jgi:hypothetical protein
MPLQMEGVFQTQCTNEFCGMVFSQFNEQKAKLEQQKIENEVLRTSLNDCTASNDNAIYELKRLLEKETACVGLLNSKLLPDPTGMFPSCANCMYHKQQAKMVREANAQEYRHVSHFVKFSKNLRLELQDALLKEKAKNMQLKNAYDELYVRKTDPLSRDAEVARLRGELQEAKQHHLNANQTALMANRVTETLRKELQMTQQRVSDLEVETHNQSVKIKTLEEIVDTCRRSDELKDCSIGLCKDWVCTKRVMDLYDQQREHRTEINTLQREQAYHINTIAQLRREAQQWQVLTGQDGADESEGGAQAEALPVEKAKLIKRAQKAILVADMTKLDDLNMNLRSLFTTWAAWTDETLDGDQMLSDFLMDLPPVERKPNLVSILLSCHGLNMPSGIKESDLEPSNKLVRSSFFACLRSMGGVSKKVHGKTIWTNIKMNRRPIYLNSQV